MKTIPNIHKPKLYWGNVSRKKYYTPQPYIKVKMNITSGLHYLWSKPTALKNNHYYFWEVNKEGENIHIVSIAHQEDIIWIKPALLSKEYGQLEIIKS